MKRLAVRAALVGTSVVLAGWAAMPALGAPVPDPDVPPAPTVTAPTTVSVGTGSEAWYQLTRVDTCTSPAGCLPADVSALPDLSVLPVDPTVYPPDTLHVGWAGGIELARTYLTLDTSSIPKGATLVSGSLELPLIGDPTSGTVLADSAGVKACLVSSPFSDGVVGSLGTAPAMDCSVSSPLSLDGSSFVVDLQPFIDAWASGAEDNGIAITPFTSSSVQSAWAVALPGRNATGLPHIGATLEYLTAQAATPPSVVTPPAPPQQLPATVTPGRLPNAGTPIAAAPHVVKPATPQEIIKAAGKTPFGWLVLGAGLLALVALVWVVREQEPAALIG